MKTTFARSALLAVDLSRGCAFKAWYQKTNGIAFVTGYKPEYAWPNTPDSNRLSNRLIVAISDARDKHILGVIDRALVTNAVVLPYQTEPGSLPSPSCLCTGCGPHVLFSNRIV